MEKSDKIYPVCHSCGFVLDGSDFNHEGTTMEYGPEKEIIDVCIPCFEELGGYDQI